MKGKLPASAVQTLLRHASWWLGTTPSEGFFPSGYLHCEDSQKSSGSSCCFPSEEKDVDFSDIKELFMFADKVSKKKGTLS